MIQVETHKVRLAEAGKLFKTVSRNMENNDGSNDILRVIDTNLRQVSLGPRKQKLTGIPPQMFLAPLCDSFFTLYTFSHHAHFPSYLYAVHIFCIIQNFQYEVYV